MLEMLNLTPRVPADAALGYLARDAGPAALRHYSGPERRRGLKPGVEQAMMMAMVDEVDYGMLLLNDDAQVLHLNKAARRDLDANHPLQLLGRELRARHSQDVAPLRDALDSACRRGLQRLLQLGAELARASVAIVPLAGHEDAARRSVVVKLGKRQVCEELTADWFARSHGLTITETQVLKRLCAGVKPQQIAVHQGVALSTVRTQIGSIRAKTGAESIRALVRQVAVLPPLVNTLHA
jgi:DNA-binding CsgD family transcriptional regulator